jgi:hypothetical protein
MHFGASYTNEYKLNSIYLKVYFQFITNFLQKSMHLNLTIGGLSALDILWFSTTCLCPRKKRYIYMGRHHKMQLLSLPGSAPERVSISSVQKILCRKILPGGKKKLDLNEYQTRSEESYHKHMALVMLAQLFINRENIYHYEQEKLWMTIMDVIQSLKSIIQFIKEAWWYS